MNKTHTPNADSAPALADQGTAGSAQPVRTLVKGFRRGRVPLETVQLPLPGFEQALTDPPRDTSPAGGRAAVRDDAPSSDQGPVAADRSEQALDLTLSHPSFSSDTSVFPASAEGAVGSLWVQAGTSAGATATDASAGANASGSAASYLSGLSASNAILLGLGFIAAGALVFRTEEKAPINLAPVLAKPLVDLAAVEGEAFSVVLDRSSFVDPEGAAVTWSLAAVKNSNGDAVSLNWLVFDPVALTLTGTPDALSRGDYELTIKVVDGQGLEAVDHFIFSVAPNSTVFDGYLKYALVFRDEIADGIWDHEPINAIAFETDSLGKVKVASISYTDLNNDGQFTAEPWALTNNAGLAPPVGGSGVLRTAAWQEGGTIDGVAIGGTVDISTGRPFESVLSAPAGSGVISPVTTLITAQLGAGAATANPAAIAAASQQVAGLLFGSGTAVDLLNLDPVKNLASGATGDAAKLALQVQAAGQQVANILQVAVAAAQAGGVVDLASVTGAVTSSLLGSATGGSLDLGDTAKLNAAIASVASLVTNADAKALIEQQSAAIAQTIATVNQKISTVITTAVTQINSGATFSVADVLTDTTAFQLVAQQTLAQQVSSAVSNAVSDPGSTGPVDFNINVDQAVEEVRDQVQQVIVPTTPNSAPTLVSGGVVTGAATEGMSPVQLSGSFGFSDPDTADLPVVGVTSRTFTGVAADGSTVLDLTAAQKLALGLGFSVDAASSNTNVGTVDWSYLLPAAAVDFLAAGDQVTGTFVVTVNDRKGGSVAQTITVTLTGTNDAPVATFNAAQAVNEDASSLTGQLTATDQDNGAALSYSLVGDAIAGFTLNANGSWSFDPKNAAYQSLAQGQTQAITVNYKVTDDKQAQASGAFVVTVTGTNDAPLISVAQGNSASATLTEVNQGLTGSGTLTVADADLTNTVVATVHSVAASGLTAGLGLDNAALLAMMTVNSPNTVIGNDAASGVIGWSFSSGSEAFNYLPAGQSITLTYTIRATDSNSPSTSDDQSVTITITGSNDTPLIVVGTGNSAAETLTETNAGLSVSGSLGVTDPEVSDTVTVAVQSVTTAGVVAGLSADNAALLAMLTLNNQSAVINNTSTTGTINWTFASGSEGFNYLAAGQQLVLTYTVRATDSSNAGSYDDQTVVITVTGTNDVPVATFSAAQAVAEDATALTGQLTATDADAGAVLSYALVGQAIAGLTINSNGSWTFDPTNAAYQSLAQGQTQEITVNYEVSDQNQGKGTGSFKVTVTGTNDVPVATFSAAQAVAEDATALTGQLTATDADAGAVLSYALVGNAIAGLTINSNGSWTFDPTNAAYQSLAQGQTQEITVNYQVSDQNQGVGTGSFKVTVTGTNDVPVATFSAAQAVAEDATALTGQLTATDADAGAVLSYALVGQAIAGLTINSNGSWTFDPTNAAYQSLAQGQTQEITVNYEVSDQNQGKGTGSFKVTVTGTNDVPVITATDVSGSITEPSLSTASATLTDSGSLTFADVDGLDRPSATEATKSITASRVVNNVSSTITLTSEQVQLIENAFSITPQSSNTNNGTVDWSYSISESVLHFLGQGDTVTAVFTVTVGNQALGQATQDVTITIAGSNDAPVATGETLSAIEDTPITFIARTSNSGTQNSNTNPALLANETDPDHANEALSIKSVTAISGGTVTLTNEGHVSFVPTAHFNGQAQFSYVVTDGLHDSAPVTATVNVTPVEDAPVVSIKRVVEEAVQEVSAAPQPGVTLRVEYSDVDGHTHAGANPTYQWFANGVAIPGATATDLVLSQSLVGKLIGVSVAFADGGGTVYQHPGSTTTNPTATQTLAFAVAASNVAPTLTGDPLSPQSGAIGQAVSIPAGARFADAGDTLIFSARLSTGEALPSGVSIDPATGTVSGTLNAGWLGSKTLLVTATDTAGNSVSDSVVVTTTAPAGVYLAGKMIEMTDFGAANAFAAPGAAGFDSAAYASMSAGRLQLTLSENQGGVSTGAELNGVNLRALIDRDGNGNRIDSTGVAPYLSLPIDSILATGQSVQSVNGSMTLSVTLSVLGQVQQVSATVNVTLTQTASAVQLSVNGAQTVPLLLGGQPFGASISFGAGDLLGASSAATDSASGQDMLDLYLMGLLSRLGQTTSSFIDDYLTGQMTFSVSFSGLPVFDRSGQALAGLDATVVVADAPNRAPALTLPAMDVSAQQPIPALVVPVGSEIKLGSVLAAGLQAAPNGEAHLLLVSAPTAGKLVLDGGAVVFPSPSGALPAGFVLVDGQVMLKLMAADLGRLTYRAPSMAGSATVTAPELASVVVQAMDAHGAKSPPVLYGLGLDGAPSAVMVMAVGEADRLLDLDGDALIDGDGKVEALFTGNATEGKVIALPDPALGVLNIREGQTVRPVALNEVISKTAILSFDPVNTTAPNTPLRDDVLLEINQGGQLIYRRFDVQLTNQGSELAPTLGLTDVTTSIPEGTVIAAEGVKVATIANSGTPSAPVELTLSGPDQALFQIVGTELRFKPGSAPLDYETKTAYRVQVNADNPAIGLAGSIEASQSYELQVGNIADTLELASNSLTLTDVGTSGAARTVSLSGSYATSGGLRTLQFESTGTQNGLSLSNLRQLFDADPNSGVSPTLSFSLGDTAAVVTGTHTVHARATLVGEVIGVSLPLEMAFSAQVSLERDLSGQLKAVLPAQTVQLKMSAAGLDIATISLNNLDADTFALVSGTNQTASIELKLWNLIDKAGDRDIALSQLGTTGAIALAGAMVAGGLGDRTLQELVTLAKDVTTIPSELNNASIGRLIDLLRDTVSVPDSLKAINLSQLLDLGAALINVPSSINTVGSLLSALRANFTLPVSLQDDTLSSLKQDVQLSTQDQQLVERIETLARQVLGSNGTPYAGSLGDKTIVQMLDLIATSPAASMSFPQLAVHVDSLMGDYTAFNLLSDAADVVNGLWGNRASGEAVIKLMDAVTLPDPNSALGQLPLADIFDLGGLLLGVGQILVGSDGLQGVANLLAGNGSAVTLINLVKNAVTVDGVIDAPSLATVIDVLDRTFDLDRAFEGQYDVADLIADLRAPEPSLPLAPMILLGGNALFSSNSELSLAVDVGGLGLLDASDRIIDQIVVVTPMIPV